MLKQIIKEMSDFLQAQVAKRVIIVISIDGWWKEQIAHQNQLEAFYALYLKMK